MFAGIVSLICTPFAGSFPVTLQFSVYVIRSPAATSPLGLLVFAIVKVCAVWAVTVVVVVFVIPLTSVIAAVFPIFVPLYIGALSINTTSVTAALAPGATFPKFHDTTLPAALPVLPQLTPPAQLTYVVLSGTVSLIRAPSATSVPVFV